MFSQNYPWPKLKPGTRITVKTKKPGGGFWWEKGIKLDNNFVQLDRGPVAGYPKDNHWSIMDLGPDGKAAP